MQEIELGQPYVFEWVGGRELTGIAVRRREGYVTFRTKNLTFTVATVSVRRKAEPHGEE